MGWIFSKLYDSMMEGSEQACLTEWRRKLLCQLAGSVLEVGAGTGRNMKLYPASLSRLVMTEPDPHMRARLLEKVPAEMAGRVEVADVPGERIPYPDTSFDAAVSTLVFCSVADLTGTLAELYRILKPNGKLVFIEHVAAAPGTSRKKWQRRVEPLWKWMAGNCHLTRLTEEAIRGAGFEVESIEYASIRKAFPLVRPSIRGIAVKPAG